MQSFWHSPAAVGKHKEAKIVYITYINLSCPDQSWIVTFTYERKLHYKKILLWDFVESSTTGALYLDTLSGCKQLSVLGRPIVEVWLLVSGFQSTIQANLPIFRVLETIITSLRYSSRVYLFISHSVMQYGLRGRLCVWGYQRWNSTEHVGIHYGLQLVFFFTWLQVCSLQLLLFVRNLYLEVSCLKTSQKSK